MDFFLSPLFEVLALLTTSPSLPAIWFAIVCFEVGLYVLLDGADLGLGMLALVPQKEKERSLIMHTVGPIWNANETWLVIAAGTLFGAFPTGYGIILNALYIPVMIMLFGLMFRAVAFEFHAFSLKKKKWGVLFGVGSLLAVLGQGLALGGILNGIAISNGQFSGTAFDFISPLALFITIGVMMSYVVVGYAYLIKKTEYEMRSESFLKVFVAATITFAALLSATVLLPNQSYLFLTRWSVAPTSYMLFAIAFCIGILSLLLIYDVVRKHKGGRIYNTCSAIFICAALGIVVGVFPYLIPPVLTIYDAAASPATLKFMLWGIGPLIPIVLAYNFYLHQVFEKDLRESHHNSYE
jgi:cytochrome d ubiquinol oxidase subunit II